MCFVYWLNPKTSSRAEWAWILSNGGTLRSQIMSHRPNSAENARADTPTASSKRTVAQTLGLEKWPGADMPGADRRGEDEGKGASTSTANPAVGAGVLALVVVSVGTILRLGMLALLAVVNDDNVWGLLNKWDAAHYVGIAAEGYFAGTIGDAPAEEIRLAFFPAFPMIMRVIHNLTGLDFALAGIIFNFLGTVCLARGIMALSARWGYGLKGQSAAAIVVTTAPMAIVFNMPYTEALFGALTIWALVALLDKRWWLAGVFIFALSFVRITAIALVAVFAISVLLHAWRSWKAWVALVVSPLPLVGYMWWASAQLDGVGGYFGTQDKHWNSGFDAGVATLKWVFQTLTSTENAGYLLTTLVIIGVPLALVVAWRRVDVGTWLFSLALSANVILSDGVMHSRPRLLLPAAVLFIPWAHAALRHLPRWVAWTCIGCWALFGTWLSAYMLAVFPWAI